MSQTDAASATPAAPAPAARLPIAWVTLALIAANVAVFAIEMAVDASPWSPTAQEMLKLGGNLPSTTLHGEWWRLGSAMFLHYGPVHLGLNMLCLWQARVVELTFGRVAFAAIYLVSGLGGGVATAMIGRNAVSAGASGAVFGVYGAFVVLLLLRRAQFRADAYQRVMRSMGGFLGVNLAFGLMTPGIDMSAHVGGLIAGAAAGAALLVGASGPSVRRAIALVVVGVATTAAALALLRPPHDASAVLGDLAQVESRCIARANEILDAIAKGGDRVKLADDMERDVIAPWHALDDELRSAGPPERLAPLFALLDQYVTARERAWRAYADAMRAPAADEDAELALARRLDGEAQKLVQDIQAETARLSR